MTFSGENRVPIANRIKGEKSDRELTADLADIVDRLDDIDRPCAAYDRNIEAWAEIDACNSGTIGLRKLAAKYLPMQPGEDGKAYSRRVGRAYYAPWYQKLRDAAIAQILRRPIEIADTKEAARSIAHMEDVDLLGNDINSFAREFLKLAIDQGCPAILVDYPNVDRSQLTLADVEAMRLRPYWMAIAAKDILRVERIRVNGYPKLVSIALSISGDTPQVQIYRDVNGYCWIEYYEKIKDKWIYSHRRDLEVDRIPIVPLTDFFASPIMLEIACLNLKHYQRCNDLDFALHIAANPKLILFGYSPNPGEQIVFRVDEAMAIEDPKARAEWLVCDSINFEAQERHIATIEAQMKSLAISAMVGSKDVAESGIAKQLDRTQSDAMLAVLAQSLQDTIDSCLEIHCQYMGVSNPPACQVNRDFQLSKLTAEEVKTYSELEQIGQITKEQLLASLVDGEWLAEETDIDETVAKLNGESNDNSEILSP